MEKNSNLSKGEQKIADFIDNNFDKVGYMSIRSLAKEIGVSTSTIVRYIKKLSFDSYTDFQAKCIEKQNQLMENNTNSSVDLIDCLKQLETEKFFKQLQAASKLINSAELILFGGVGNNEGIAQYAAHCFSSNNKFALSLNHSFYNLTSFPKNTVCIALSVSGESMDMIQLVKDFRSKHIPILVISANNNSTLSVLSDLTISYDMINQEDENTTNINSIIPIIYIIEKLASNLKG